MVEPDAKYVEKCINAGLVMSPCLEIGVGYEGPNNKRIIEEAGIEYLGADIIKGADVNYIVDFEAPSDSVERAVNHKRFGSILALNVLEHTFDPIRALDNIFRILRPGGTGIIITPSVWPLHNYPKDCWRINPDFYEEYCKRRSLLIIREYFEYVGFHNVRKTQDKNGVFQLPRPSQNKVKSLRSRIVHKLFGTYGRSMFFPSHIATGIVIKNSETQ